MEEKRSFTENMDVILSTPYLKKLQKVSSQIALLVGVLWICFGSYVLYLDSNQSPAQIMVAAGFGWILMSFMLKKVNQLVAAKDKAYNFMLLFNSQMKGVATNEDKMLVDFMWCLFHYDTGTRQLGFKWRKTARVAYNKHASLVAVKALKNIKNSELKQQEILPEDLTDLETENFSLVIERLVFDKEKKTN